MEAYVVIGGTVFLQDHGSLVCVCFNRVVGQVALYNLYECMVLHGLCFFCDLYDLYDFCVLCIFCMICMICLICMICMICMCCRIRMLCVRCIRCVGGRALAQVRATLLACNLHVT